MSKKGLLILCFFVSWFINYAVAQPAGQRPMYTSTWGHLYREAGNNKDLLGVFPTEAPVYLLDSTNTQYKVQVSNGDIGFIDRQPLKSAMYGKKSAGEPQQYFYRGTTGAQCPHFYIQVSQLRVRKASNTTSTAVRRAGLNEMVCIDYVPLYTDGWVYIGDHFHQRPEYIQMKYLGAQLTYEKVLKDYLDVKGKDQEKELAAVGRLREIGWTKYSKLKEALTYWKETYTKAGVVDPKVDIDFELVLADKFHNELQSEVYAKKLKALNFHFEWKGVSLFDGKITDAQMKQLALQRVSEIPDMPECGWEPQYYYKTPNMIVAFEKNNKGRVAGSLYQLFFSAGETIVMGSERMDANYAEKDFVDHVGDLLSANWITDPHVYYIQNGDAGLFIFRFADGKLASYECMFYC
ncbi:hypothetical protein [Sphingobacterium sp. UBA5996]|uniref:hypothetical protein n=1 Tax=Sphingobacterium sp. UBA5996 TaxID=1947505 RepID=UPI0025EFF769|nr:hypothetical protein [Sphingobacterium sp. UBA5996]